MSVGSVLEAARRRGVPAERTFQRGGYGKARYSADLDREADRQFFQNNAKQDYIEQIFRWHKEGALRDGEHFLAQIPALLKLPGGITAKQAARLRRILSKHLACQPGLASDPQYTRLEQYLDTRRKITNEVKSVIFSLANSLTKSMTRKEAFEAAWRTAAAGAVRTPAARAAFGNRREAPARLNRYNPADIRTYLVPEPDNPYDKNAIAVQVGIQNGKGLYTVGYVPRGDAVTVRALMKAGKAKPRIKVIRAGTASAQLLLEF